MELILAALLLAGLVAPEDYEARCKRWYCPAVGPCVCREFREPVKR